MREILIKLHAILRKWQQTEYRLNNEGNHYLR